ncbi:MAG: alpha/beta hydrolase [Epsilonproteobacteria bacterium]|nr:alpha/beta hydrolase [Campylobacterota bacterium]
MALKEINYNQNSYSISYEIENPKGEDTLIVLHGWGSNKELMKQAFSPYSTFKTVYIDLPGFGKSSTSTALTTLDYAHIIGAFLDSINVKKDIVMGHSFGGKIATLLEPKLLVLLSSAGILEKKSLKVKAKIWIYKLLRRFGGEKIREFFVSKDAKGIDPLMYETFKKVVDENFEDIFKNYPKKTLIFWGKEDTATPLKSGKKLHQLIKNSQFFELEGDHYFFLNSGKFIIEKIKEQYEKL